MKGKLVNRSLRFFPLGTPTTIALGKNGKRGSGCTTCFKRRDQNQPIPPHPWPDGQKHALFRRLSDDSFASATSSRVPGQARGLAGFIRLADSAIWPFDLITEPVPRHGLYCR